MPEIDLYTTLKDARLTVIDKRLAPLNKRFEPQGVGLHHTAALNLELPAPSLAYVLSRRLCHLLIARDCTVYVISQGITYHFGRGNPSVLAATRNNEPPAANTGQPFITADGNPHYYGIEIENNGYSEEWKLELLDTSSRAAAAICQAHGWSENRVVLHKEWAPWRKIDPRWGSGAEWRSLVAGHLRPDTVQVAAPIAPPPYPIAPEVDSMRFVKRPSPDDRVYLTNGAWKERMITPEDWDQKAHDLGITKTPAVLDAGLINRMLTIGDDPV